MIILGLYFGHNAAACVLKDGEVLINWELERFTRIKHDFGFSQEFIDKTLEHCGLTMNDVDHIACNNPVTITRWIEQHMPERKLNFKVPSAKTLEYKKFDRGYIVNHHLAHAASTYYTSPFNTATIFTWDGGGDSENSSVSQGVGNKIEQYKPDARKNLAAYWSSITINNYRMKRVHEWDPGSGAGKVMGLASYGNANEDLIRTIERTLSEAPRHEYYDPRARAYNNCEDLSDTKTSNSQNVAASLQSLTTRTLLTEIDDIYTGNQNLCYAGGLALNCIANREIIKQTKFEKLHVPPFPNDTGLAIGCALYIWHHVLDNPKKTSYFSPYTGPDYNVGQPDIERVGNLLADNKVICYYEGRSESGPRALGHRSILCNPGIDGIRDRLNYKVKMREWYRPYAPIIPEENAKEMLLDYNEWSPYMQTSAIVKHEYDEALSGVTQVDGSTRAQILKHDHNETLYNIIQQSKLPALLNTSFNYQEPIVETPEQAKATFDRMKDVDVLVIGDKIYER